VSAHPASERGGVGAHPRGLLSSMAAQLAAYVLEPVEETVDPEPVELVPYPVIAVVSAAAKSGATTVARLLAAELGLRAEGAAVVTSARATGRGGPPIRAAARLATALRATADVRPVGRLCLAAAAHPEALAEAARYLAPVVLDLPPDGSAAGIARVADRVAIVASASGEPALTAAVALVLGGEPIRVANRITERAAWEGRADIFIPESRLAARAALMGTRAVGPMGAAIADLAAALEGDACADASERRA
jgi:hypothetical protein